MHETVKNKYLQLLQQHTSWGKDDAELEKAAEAIFELVDFVDIKSVEELKSIFKSKSKTRILIDTNEIASPIRLDNQIELPIVELFIDNGNFVVFTTKHIYNCRNEITRKIGYGNIVSLDENSINNALRDRLKRLHLFDVELVMTSGENVPITVEYGISLGPILSFLMGVNKNNIE